MNKVLISLLASSMAGSAMAGISLGNPESESGAFSLLATLRANYQDKDYGEPVSSHRKLQFDTGIFRLGYESPDWFGKAEYRCYQYDTFCDFSTLVYAYAGYKLNGTDNITVGLQPIPFGSGRFWDSSFYAGINNTMGLQDALNLGVNYHFELPASTKMDVAYFATDGGNYTGSSQDAARYTANMVKTSDSLQTSLKEKNMWMARVNQDLNFLKTDELKVAIGGSYWYSDIENQNNHQDGSRQAWALFNTINYQNLGITLTGGQLKIDNRDAISSYSTFGSFDGEYDLANKGLFYTVDTNYTFKNVQEHLDVTPYLVLSGYQKKQQGFKDSQRNIVGVAWSYKNIALYSEYIMSKNDPFVGGTGSSLAAGDDNKWNKLLNMTFIYNF